MTTSMTSLASSRPAVDEPVRCRDADDDDTDTDDKDTSSGRRSRMTTTTLVDELNTCTVELEMDSRQCTPHHGIHHCHYCQVSDIQLTAMLSISDA